MPEPEKPATPESEKPPSVEKRFSDEVFDKILRALREKKVLDVCPRCQTNGWTVDAANFLVSSAPSAGFRIPPPAVPVLTLICNNCGFLAMHHPMLLGLDLKALGLQP